MKLIGRHVRLLRAIGPSWGVGDVVQVHSTWRGLYRFRDWRSDVPSGWVSRSYFRPIEVRL